MNSTKINPGVNLPKAGAESKKQHDLKKACKDFEAVFTYQLLKSMRRTVEKCDLFHGGQGEEIYESMFDMELSKRMAGSGRNSLSEMLYSQLRKQLSPEEGHSAKSPDSAKTEAGDQMSEVVRDRKSERSGDE